MGLRTCILTTVLLGMEFASPAVAQFTSSDVNRSIDRGVQNLLTRRREDGSFKMGPWLPGHNALGANAYVLYTLVKSGGLPAEDPVIRDLVAYLKQLPIHDVYDAGTLIMGLDALESSEYDEWIGETAQWIVENEHQGKAGVWAYTGAGGEPEMSTTQYAVWGLQMAEKNGFPIPTTTWERVVEGTVGRQNDDGGFRYKNGVWSESSGSMTAAGLFVLHVALERLNTKPGYTSAKKNGQAAIDRGWAWLEPRFTVTGNPAWMSGALRETYPDDHLYNRHFYYLASLERLGAVSGRARIGGMDWYQEAVMELFRHQADDGGWGSETMNTCFALQFLRRVTLSSKAVTDVSSRSSEHATWRFTTVPPADGWQVPAFDDTGWKEGMAGFGTVGASGAVVRTPWDTPDIWLRRTFQWYPGHEGTPHLYAVHDDSVEIYVNGHLAINGAVWSGGRYATYDVSKEVESSLVEGANVLAVHCHDIGGDQSIDVRVRPPASVVEESLEAGDAWWGNNPGPEVPFLRRWLVLGEFEDEDHAFSYTSDISEAESIPVEGQRGGGKRWRHQRTSGGWLPLVQVDTDKDRSSTYVFTWLHAEETVESVLWLGSGDGVRVWLDGAPLFSHHEHREAQPDQQGVYLHLGRGAHRLLLKVEAWDGESGLWARLTDREGRALGVVHPSLSQDGPTLDLEVLDQPSRFDLAQLLEWMPQVSPRQDFGKAGDLAFLGIGPMGTDPPQWVSRDKKGETGPQPHPGAKGILRLGPGTSTDPTRLVFRTVLPARAKEIALKLCADAKLVGTSAAARVRLGLYDGVYHGLATAVVEPGDAPSSRAWTTIKTDPGEWSGQDVLVIVEVDPSTTLADASSIFIDNLQIR